MRGGEFFWINRAYATNRKLYQDALRLAKDEDPTVALLSKMEMIRDALVDIFDRVPSRIEVGQLLPFGPKESMVVERSTATREGEPTGSSNTVDGYFTVRVAALTSAEACGYQRRGRWGKGGGRHCGKGTSWWTATSSVLSATQLEPVTDAHVATEVARREAMARTRGVPFSMDKVVFNSPRRSRIGTRAGSSSSDPTRTRSSYGLLKDMAKNHLRSFRKKGFTSLVDRLQRDAFYHFNAANQNLIPEALLFIERLAGCVSPTIERSKAQVYGERLDFATKLVFVPNSDREKDEPLDLHKEVFICHRGVFLDIGQFTVYVAKFIVPKKKPLPLVHGWLNQEFVPDGEDAKVIGKELVEFAKIQWIEFASGQAHHEPDASGADREVSLPHATTSVRLHYIDEPLPRHEQFEPNVGKKGGHSHTNEVAGGKTEVVDAKIAVVVGKIAQRASNNRKASNRRARRAMRAKDRERGSRRRASRAIVHREVFADNFSSVRLQRQAVFLLTLTGVETGYMLFMSSGFYSMEHLARGLRSLKLYFALRATAILLFLSMACICPPFLAAARQQWSPPGNRRCWSVHIFSQAGHFLFVSILVLSYFLLPAYANKGMSSVPDNVVALMTLPVYAAVMMSYQQDFLTSVVYIAAFAVMIAVLAEIPATKSNGYPSEGITFLGYSMIFALKAYIGERSLREQFKARHAINDCKVHIEGILETLMPERVIDELQRMPPGASAPSHQYYRATLVQSDLIGFTSMASLKPPEWVVQAVCDLFGEFDELADEYGIYKVETVGDAYIAGQAELPLTEENYPPSVIQFGLKMVQVTKRWSMAAEESIGVRVGVHSGECIGGIVGIDMQRYHLFGKLIHELELLESTAPENGLHVSHACKAAVEQAWNVDRGLGSPARGVCSPPRAPAPGCPGFEFWERPEMQLTTSKGEIHQYSEVGGKTYTVRAVVGNGLDLDLPRRQRSG
eukprot:s2259_g4.t1